MPHPLLTDSSFFCFATTCLLDHAASKRKKASTKETCLAAAAGRHQDKRNDRRGEAMVLKWEGISQNFIAKKDSLANRNGMARTVEENKMIVLALRGSVGAHLNMVKLRARDAIHWTAIEKEVLVAATVQVGQNYVKSLRQEFLTTGEVMVWERRAAAPDGEAADEITRACPSPSSD
jgi:hypothetical protein